MRRMGAGHGHPGRRIGLALLLAWGGAQACWAQAAGSATPADTRAGEVAGGDQGGGLAGEQTGADAENFALHGQATFIEQVQGGFASPYQGANSLRPGVEGRETFDATLFLGARLWRGAEVWIDPEIDQGFGLSNTLGVAGFVSGEAYKVGAAVPYLKLQRVFVRQVFDLGGDRQAIAADLNQFARTQSADRMVVTVGKFSVGDVFDTNSLAHDPRGDFLNWTIIDAGSFDYAADAWGYSAGAAAEWYAGRWILRGGAFLLSNVPNSSDLDTSFTQFQSVGEIEERHALWGQPGRVALTGFVTRGRMARLDDAVALGRAAGLPPDLAGARRYASRPGASLNAQQQITAALGVFARAGWADGAYEAYEFTDVDRSLSSGMSLGGAGWGRPDDTVGLAGVVNVASAARQAFLAAGGLGILVGDGRLPHPGPERIVEGYYDVGLARGMHVAIDAQWVDHPGYNRDRGPVPVLAIRLHGQF